MNLKGHTALITGAGQGIGKACALVFAERGADLVLVERNPVTLNAVKEECFAKGREVYGLQVDLTDFGALRSELEKIPSSLTVDILVNNAGFDRPGTSAKIDREAFESVLGVHLTVPLILIQVFLPSMRKTEVGEDHQCRFHLRPYRCKGGTGLFHGQSRDDGAYKVSGKGSG